MSEQHSSLDETDDLLAVAHLLARVRLRRLVEESVAAPETSDGSAAPVENQP